MLDSLWSWRLVKQIRNSPGKCSPNHERSPFNQIDLSRTICLDCKIKFICRIIVVFHALSISYFLLAISVLYPFLVCRVTPSLAFVGVANKSLGPNRVNIANTRRKYMHGKEI